MTRNATTRDTKTRNAEARDPSAPCPCGSGATLAACCGRWLGIGPGAQRLQAPTAEALMRSRYTAHVLEDEPYLLASWHAGKRPAAVRFEPGTRWLGLSVKKALDTGPDRAEVEFVARYRTGGAPAVRLTERSRFVREQGRWLYVDGDQR